MNMTIGCPIPGASQPKERTCDTCVNRNPFTDNCDCSGSQCCENRSKGSCWHWEGVGSRKPKFKLINIYDFENYEAPNLEVVGKEKTEMLKFYQQGVKDGVTHMLNMIFSHSAVDPESLRPTACWQENGDYVETVGGEMLPVKTCSRCHMDIVLEDFESYCPHCGARMVNKWT